MPITPKPAQPEQDNPYLPSGPQPLIFEQFQGINTATTRPGVPDEQAYWIDGFFPLAVRNLRTLYGIGSAIYTAAGPTVVMFAFANLGSTPLMIVLLSDGSVVQVNTNTQAVTTILPASTVTSPSILNFGVSQFGNQYVILVANQTNGYWLWNGSLLFAAGTIAPIITITNNGGGYSTAPTVVVTGGHGHGTSLVPIMVNGAVSSISVVNQGAGYVVGDSISISFIGAPSGGSSGSMVGIISSGTLSSISIVNGGTGYTNPTITFSNPGIGGVHAAANAIVVSGTITGTSITNPGSAYSSITISITDVGVTATATGTLMPFGVSGTTVETYSARVWVGNGATIYFSVAATPWDFSTSNGGGNFTSNDSFLRVGFVQLIQSNGFLYLVADSSVNYISGVQTSGSPPSTTFTNQNADPQVGTPYPASVEVAGQDILFANSFGVHTLYGARAVKVSDMLDGVYSTVPNFGGLQLSASQAVIFGRKVWMVLSKIVDPVGGSSGNKILLWDGKRWFAATQEVTLTYIKHQEINSVITAYGTDGTSVYPLFTTPSTGFLKTVQSRYFDAPGGYQFNKAVSRLWAMAQYYSTSAPNIQFGIDAVLLDPTTLVTTETRQNYTITGPASTGYFILPPMAVGQQGVLTGLTIKTLSADMALISAMIQDPILGYRG